MEQLIANYTGKPRTAQYKGRSYLVTNLTMIVPGVLNGSQGKLLYAPEEIQKNFLAWNGVPIVLEHPVVNGNHVSARQLSILEESQLGFILNARFDKKLVAEGWFDIEETKRIAPSIFNKLERGLPVEISTGLWVDRDPVGGIAANGKSYDCIAKNFRPDHLAVLARDKGACSNTDGCGVNVNMANSESKTLAQKLLGVLGFKAEELTPVTNSEGSGDNPPNSTTEGDNPMAGSTTKLSPEQRKSIIDSLVGNCEGCPSEDRATFEKLSDQVLNSMQEGNTKAKENEILANAALSGFEDPNGNKHAFKDGSWTHTPKAKETVPPVTTNSSQEAPKSTEDYLKTLPVEVRSVVANAMAWESQQKDGLIKDLTKHLKGEEQKQLAQHLATNSLAELQTIQRLIPAQPSPQGKPEAVPQSYFGASAPVTTNTGNSGKGTPANFDEDDMLGMPVMNFAKAAK